MACSAVTMYRKVAYFKSLINRHDSRLDFLYDEDNTLGFHFCPVVEKSYGAVFLESTPKRGDFENGKINMNVRQL